MENETIKITKEHKEAMVIKEAIENGITMSRVEQIIGNMTQQQLLDLVILTIRPTAEELVNELEVENGKLITKIIN